MATDVIGLVDMLFEMIDEAKGVPFNSEKCMLERDKALDLIDEIRAQYPVELLEAKRLLARKGEFLESAKQEAEQIRKQSENQAARLLSEDSQVIQAQQKADEMLRDAEQKSRELRRAASEYCEDVLRRTEEAVADAYAEIKGSHSRFRSASGSENAAASAAPERRIYDAAADEN